MGVCSKLKNWEDGRHKVTIRAFRFVANSVARSPYVKYGSLRYSFASLLVRFARSIPTGKLSAMSDFMSEVFPRKVFFHGYY